MYVLLECFNKILYVCSAIFDWRNIDGCTSIYFNEKFDSENIDGQYLRLPV